MKPAAAVFAIVGILLLAYCLYVYVDAARFQSAAKEQLRRPSEPPAPAKVEPAPPARGEPMALLTIPRIGLSSVVLEGAGAGELKRGPGHISRTPLPGAGGNFAVAGHRDTFFRPLRLIRVNDLVNVDSASREYRYRVVSTEIVAPKDVGVLASTGRDTLTLVTCYPFDFVGAASQRFVVHADCETCPAR
jgi:sortase A